MNEYSKNTIKKVERAKKCQMILSKIEDIERFKKHFHFRINANNYVIISTLEGNHDDQEIGSYMNGLVCVQKDIKFKVEKLIKKIKITEKVDIDRIDLGEFPQRTGTKKYDEYKSQAMFIRALCGDEKYEKFYLSIKDGLKLKPEEELRFVASEFTLFSKEDDQNKDIVELNWKNYLKGIKRKKRVIDVIGACGDTLYYFEIKREGEVYNDVYSQIDDYRNYFKARKKEVQVLLNNYPLFPASFAKERFVVVIGMGDTIDKEKIENVFMDSKNKNEDNVIIEKADIIAFK